MTPGGGKVEEWTNEQKTMNRPFLGWGIPGAKCLAHVWAHVGTENRLNNQSANVGHYVEFELTRPQRGEESWTKREPPGA